MLWRNLMRTGSSGSVMGYKDKILSYRKQEEVLDGWLKQRLDRILPDVMNCFDQDVWILACEEYNEDPILHSFTPVSMITARRKMVLVFVRNEDGSVHRFAITRPHIGLDEYYTSIWTKQAGQDWGDLGKNPYSSIEPETQMECLQRLIKKVQPKTIALNTSKHFVFGDGLSHTLYEELTQAITAVSDAPIVSSEKLCVNWLETRLDEEMDRYHEIVEIAHAMIADAYSAKVITPGVTTNLDVKYFMMQCVIDLGLTPWFDFEVSIIRQGHGQIETEEVIQPGDVLHCDVGLKYLGLCSDTQELAYILKADEMDASKGLRQAMQTVNQLQDIVVEEMKLGRSGNEILASARQIAISQGLKPCIYTHPIGYHGHGAGPTIGLWDMQQGVEGLNGSYPLHDHTLYSLELNAEVEIPEWKESITLGMETDIILRDGKITFAHQRQTDFHVVKK